MKNLETGLLFRQTATVQEDMLACRVGSGELAVYATPALIALVEKTAAEGLKEYLLPEQSSVGTKAEISHLAPTPLGMQVTAEVVIQEIDRRRVVFSVRVTDEKEKIAEGTHERFIIDKVRFMEKAQAKKEKA
ncbi:MAG TPA: hypothetical protein H9671_00245 [Firmicutes bacterium]|nr:hypothetical protein [Bacillota bacterium]